MLELERVSRIRSHDERCFYLFTQFIEYSYGECPTCRPPGIYDYRDDGGGSEGDVFRHGNSHKIFMRRGHTRLLLLL